MLQNFAVFFIYCHFMSNYCKKVSKTIDFCKNMLYIKSPPEKV